MARGLFTAVVLVGVILFSQTNICVAQGREDVAVVETFLNGLKRGEGRTILNLLTGPLLSEKGELVNDPEYAHFLRQRYQNASLVIKGVAKIDGRTRAVDVAIYLNSQEPPLETRFIVQWERGSWKIAEEIVDTDL